MQNGVTVKVVKNCVLGRKSCRIQLCAPASFYCFKKSIITIVWYVTESYKRFTKTTALCCLQQLLNEEKDDSQTPLSPRPPLKLLEKLMNSEVSPGMVSAFNRCSLNKHSLFQLITLQRLSAICKELLKNCDAKVGAAIEEDKKPYLLSWIAYIRSLSGMKILYCNWQQ